MFRFLSQVNRELAFSDICVTYFNLQINMRFKLYKLDPVMGCVASETLPFDPIVSSFDDFQLDQNLSNHVPYQIQPEKCELPFKDLSEEKIKPLFQRKPKTNQPNDKNYKEFEAYKNKVISTRGMEFNFPNKKYISSTPSLIYKSKQEPVFSEDQLLSQIKQLLLCTTQFNAILSKDFFKYFFSLIEKYSWNHDQKSQLIKILIQYMKYSISEHSQTIRNQTKYTLGNFGEIFGNQLVKLVKKVKLRNFFLLLSINYSRKYENKKFSLDNVDEIVEMINQIKEFSYQNTSTLAYLSHYLVKCCQDLEREGVTADKINQKLRPVVKRLKQTFSPKQTIEEIQFEKNKKNNISEAQYVSKIENLDKKALNKFFYFKTADKDGEMSIFIMQMVNQAKKLFQKFTQITSQVCIKNSGFSYKANLKLKDSSQVMSILRVKEKLIGDAIKDYYINKTYNPSTIKELRQAQIAYLSQSMKQINQKMDTVEFVVNDLLRGKCLFNSVEQIYLALSSLKKIEPFYNCQVVSVVNRLNGITKDVMLKIKLGDTIAEFQLALAFNQIENHIHHKLYQIQRSRVFSPVTMLFVWHDSISKDFFRDIKSILNDDPQKKIKNLHIKIGGLEKFMNYSPNLQKQNFTILCDKKDYQEFQKIKQSLKDTKILEGLSVEAELRSGICLWCMGRYKQAQVALYNYHMKQKIDKSSIDYLALVYYQRGKFELAYRCMLEFLQFELGMRAQLYEQKSFPKNFVQETFILYSELFTKLLCIVGKFSLSSSLISKNQKTIRSTYNQYFSSYLFEYIQYSKGQRGKKEIFTSFSYSGEGKKNIFKFLGGVLGTIKMIVYLFCICAHQGPAQNIEDILKLKKNTLESQYGLEDFRTIEATGDFIYFYVSLGRFRQANIYFKKYFFYAQKFIDQNSMDYLNAFKILFRYYDYQNQLQKSWEILLSFQKLVKGKNLENMKLQKKIGIFNIKSNQYEKALQAFKTAQEICLQLTDLNKKFFISLYSNMAYAYYKLKNPSKAKQLILKARQLITNITGHTSPFLSIYFFWVEYGTICVKILLEEKNYKLALYTAFVAQLFYEYKEPLFRKEKCDILLLFGDCYFQCGYINDAYNCYDNVLNIQQTFCSDYFGYHQTLSRKYQKFKQYMTKQQKKQTLTKLQDQYNKFQHTELEKIQQLLSQLITQPQQPIKTEAYDSVEMEEFYRLFAFKRIYIYKKYTVKKRHLQVFKQLLKRQKKLTGAASPFYGELLMRYFNMNHSQLSIEQKLSVLKETKPIYENIKHLYIHYINVYIEILEKQPQKFNQFYEQWQGWRLNVKEDYFNIKKKTHENSRFKKNEYLPNVSFDDEKQNSKIYQNQCLIY